MAQVETSNGIFTTNSNHKRFVPAFLVRWQAERQRRADLAAFDAELERRLADRQADNARRSEAARRGVSNEWKRRAEQAREVVGVVS